MVRRSPENNDSIQTSGVEYKRAPKGLLGYLSRTVGNLVKNVLIGAGAGLVLGAVLPSLPILAGVALGAYIGFYFGIIEDIADHTIDKRLEPVRA